MVTLPSDYAGFIHVSRYARWRDADKRRETWEETVDRYLDFMCDEQCKGKIDPTTKAELKQAILTLQVMPSMRCMMTAGKALARDNVAGFNCSAVAIDDLAAFDEMMYLLMCFHPETRVRTSAGSKSIAEITQDDLVETVDVKTGTVLYTKPSAVLCNPTTATDKLALTFSDGTVVNCTRDHLFYTHNRGWVKACDITPEDDL